MFSLEDIFGAALLHWDVEVSGEMSWFIVVVNAAADAETDLCGGLRRRRG